MAEFGADVQVRGRRCFSIVLIALRSDYAVEDFQIHPEDDWQFQL
jgi:hypothetical protein